MDLAALRTEFIARGFTDLEASGTNTRKDNWLNQAYLEICEAERWPFLQTSTTGVPPLAISDLGAVEAVINNDTGVTLHHEYRETIVRRGISPTVSGTSTRYYITDGTTVNVWPAGTGQTIKVWYWKVPALLSSGTDTPLVPTRYQNLIVDGAVRRAYLDVDNYEAAAAVESERQAGLELMRIALLRKHDPDPDREEVAAA